jgi:DegV family protein with EDD domain
MGTEVQSGKRASRGKDIMVKIITDTTAGLPAEVAWQYDVPVIPQVIIFGADSYLEGIEIDNATFLQRLITSRELPKTSAPPPELFADELQRLVPMGEPILCIHPSAEVSGTVRSATVAAADFPDADIRVIDTRVIASPLATMVTLAAEWAAAGHDADTIEARLRDLISRSRVYFLVATLEYLAKGGRIGGAAALLGSVLRIKPILTFRDGRVDQFGRERTQRHAVARLKTLVLEQIPRDGSGHLSVMHARTPGRDQALADDLRAQLDLPSIPILDVPPAIVTHGGPGILGVGFFVAE